MGLEWYVNQSFRVVLGGIMEAAASLLELVKTARA